MVACSHAMYDEPMIASLLQAHPFQVGPEEPLVGGEGVKIEGSHIHRSSEHCKPHHITLPKGVAQELSERKSSPPSPMLHSHCVGATRNVTCTTAITERHLKRISWTAREYAPTVTVGKLVE
jgi:hypothetical protein